ncbi:MAG: O-methyltransferase [Bacillales bacterium]|jgi:predicted O-methyltransferase YrrM|nr:O-methyltransferase [Bacillales bacterium]
MSNYLDDISSERNPLLQEMEQFAKEKNIPIMELNGIDTMLHFMKIGNVKSICEIGTAIGYSALRMVSALPGSTICTIERDLERYELARKYISRSNNAKQISIIFGDALEDEDKVAKSAPFDALFIDAAKGQYQRFFEIYEKYVVPGGIIFTDNVLFKGLLEEKIEVIESKRTRQLVTKIARFNDWLIKNENYETVIIPTGDGLAVSIKK